jgi:GT2 family glycosyltransferase
MVSAVIVNYNSGENLLRCVNGIYGNVFEIIIVDNASSDGSTEKVLSSYPDVKIIKNPVNEGFSKGANTGIRNSRCDYVLIMNPDVFIEKEGIDLLLKCLEEEPSLGVLAPKLVSPEGKTELSYGSDPSILNEFIQKFKSKIGIGRNRNGNVHWVSGACFMARKRALMEIGLFDENFFLYFEDADLCKRMRENGWNIKYLPSACAVHVRGGSRDSERVLLEYRKSQFLYYKKHNSWISFYILKLYLFLKFGLLFLIKRKPLFKEILTIVLKEKK